jgi:mRNA interferase MazF
VIRGAVYRIDLGEAKRRHEQRGRRFGLVLSVTDMPWNVVTVVPASTSAQPAVFRPELDIARERTRLLVDQIRSVDVAYLHGGLVDYLSRDDIAAAEDAVARYLGLDLC